jgi:hypothetical protein
MSMVFTISGVDEPDGKRCKRVLNPRTGCSAVTCVEETSKGPRWRFQKRTTRCPNRRR